MKGWKAKLRNVKEVAKARAQLAKDTVTSQGKGYNAAMKFAKDKKLMRWFNDNCEGHTIPEALETISKALAHGEITEEQSQIVLTVIDFAGGIAQ